MAAALMPLLQAGGSALVSATPSLVSRVKNTFPTAYKQVQQVLGYSQTTPEQVAGKAAKTDNAMMANTLIGTIVKAGVPPAWIRDHYPVLTEADVNWLEKAYFDVTMLEREMSTKPAIQGDPDVIAGHLVRSTEQICKLLGLTSEQLADVLAYIASHGVNDVKRYQKIQIGMGRRPV